MTVEDFTQAVENSFGIRLAGLQVQILKDFINQI